MFKQIHIGASPLSWMNSDIPSLGSHIPLEQCLSEISQIGYKALELEAPFKKIIDTFPKLLEKRGLVCIAAWHSTAILERSLSEELSSLQKHLQTLETIGGRVVNLAECKRAVHQKQGFPLSKRPRLDKSDWDRLSKGLEELAKYCQSHGFVTAYHPHMGTVVQSGEDIDTLMEKTQSLGLLFDTGHLTFAREDPLCIVKKHSDRITHVHLKNIRSSILKKKLDEDSDFFSAILEGAFTVPGDDMDGGIDFRPIFYELISRGYHGWLMVEAEQDPLMADPYTYAKLGYETTRALLIQERFRYERYAEDAMLVTTG